MKKADTTSISGRRSYLPSRGVRGVRWLGLLSVSLLVVACATTPQPVTQSPTPAPVTLSPTPATPTFSPSATTVPRPTTASAASSGATPGVSSQTRPSAPSSSTPSLNVGFVALISFAAGLVMGIFGLRIVQRAVRFRAGGSDHLPHGPRKPRTRDPVIPCLDERHGSTRSAVSDSPTCTVRTSTPALTNPVAYWASVPEEAAGASELMVHSRVDGTGLARLPDSTTGLIVRVWGPPNKVVLPGSVLRVSRVETAAESGIVQLHLSSDVRDDGV